MDKSPPPKPVEYNGDERCPEGVNYIDWLMNVLPPSELTQFNLDDLILYIRRARHTTDMGTLERKAISPRVGKLMAKLMKPKPTLTRRGF